MTGKDSTQGNPGSGNSQAYHINHAEVVAPNASTVVNNHTIVIRISFTIQISGESIERMFRALKEKFGTVWKKLHETHFDGEGQSEVIIYRLDETPAGMIQALQYIRKELGGDAAASVRYISREMHFDRGQLTLSQAIEIAEYENRL